MNLDFQGIRRLAVFNFDDRDGVVDQYVLTLLDKVTDFCSDLIIVCNGLLTPDGRRKFESYTPSIFVRDPFNYEALGYKFAIEELGIEKLNEYDEILLTNDRVFGPLYPLSEMFASMNSRDVDFWGTTMYNGADFDPNSSASSSHFPVFLHPYWLAIRKRMFSSPEFWNYWKKLPPIHSYTELTPQFSATFTKYFEDKGFSWQAYIDTRDYSEGSDDPLFLSPLDLIKNRRCPFIEKESFTKDYSVFLKSNNGESIFEAFEFIQQSLDFDVNMIWDNLLRTHNLADLLYVLHLYYVLPISISRPITQNKAKIALFIHLFFEDLIEECFAYAQSVPEQCDVYVTTNTEEKRQKILAAFANLKCNKLSVSVIDNRGRDVSALLVAPKEIIMNYDYVCFVHSKKSSHMAAITGASWRYKCFENLLKSKPFVENVISTFEENPRLGLLVPTHPSHGDYYSTLGVGEWLGNYQNVMDLAEKLNLHVDINAEKEPIAPLGSMFWFRPLALTILYEYDWDYSDFPDGSMASDGTLSHAIERIYPFVAQQSGYYSAYLLSDHFAQIETTNLNFMLRKLNKPLFKIFGLNSYNGLLNTIEFFAKSNGQRESIMGQIKRGLKKIRSKVLTTTHRN